MTISIHMMVRDGATVVDRALRSVAGLATEVVFVDTGSVDGTPDVIKRACDTHKISCSGVAVSSISRPDLFFPDEPSSWRRRFGSTFTGLPLLRDWAAARNLGLDLCTGDYVLKLDADDLYMGGKSDFKEVIDHLDSHPEVLGAACPYVVWGPPVIDRVEIYTRVWRNEIRVRFAEVCHENVDHLRTKENWLHVGGDGAVFADRRDCAGRGSRLPHRNFKTLLREYERLEAAGEAPSAHLCMYLAEEAVDVDPKLSIEILDGNFRGLSLCNSDAAWAHLIRGRCHERMRGGTRAVVDSYVAAFDLGSMRAALLAAMYFAREGGHLGWQGQLRAALSFQEGYYYPKAATISEICEAKSLLAGAAP